MTDKNDSTTEPLRIWTAGPHHAVGRTLEQVQAAAQEAGITAEWTPAADDDPIRFEANEITMGHPPEAVASVLGGKPVLTATAAQWLAHLRSVGIQ